MPLPNNAMAFMGATILGVIGAAGVYLVEHYRQERRQYAMANDLARLDHELSTLRKEFQDLLAKKRERFASLFPNPFGQNRYLLTDGIPIKSTTYKPVYVSHFAWKKSLSWNQEKKVGQENALKNLLADIDKKLDEGDLEDVMYCLIRLQDLCLEHPADASLLWRIGKAHSKLTDKGCTNRAYVQEHIQKGVEACEMALAIDDDCMPAHKWLAILIGARGDFQPMKQRIADGHLFKQHVDKAISIDPTDPTLHHMLGRFSYEVAGLKWYERQVAAALFGQPPTASFHQALQHYLKCEELAKFQWKENRLAIARCYIAVGDPQEACQWLEKAKQCAAGDGPEDKIDEEINALMTKYKSAA